MRKKRQCYSPEQLKGRWTLDEDEEAEIFSAESVRSSSDLTPERDEGGASTSGRRSQSTCWRCSREVPLNTGEEQVRDDGDDEDDMIMMMMMMVMM